MRKEVSLALLLTIAVFQHSCKEKAPSTKSSGSPAHPEAAAPGQGAGGDRKAGQRDNVLAMPDASLHGSLEDVVMHLQRGVDPDAADSGGRTPLMLSAFNGHTDIVRILLDSGAEVDLRDTLGRSALIYGSTGPFPQTVELLLERKADPNLADKDEHFTALMHAAAEGHIEVVRVLLVHGADPKMIDIDGDDAETFARQAGHIEVADLLRDLQ